MIEDLRYRLRFFVVPVEGPTEVFCDKKSVVTFFSIPTSVLKYIYNAIYYHRIRGEQAERE